MNSIKYLLFMILAIAQVKGLAQSSSDTSVVIRDFNKVLAFAVKPYLYYTSTTSMRSEPDMNPAESSYTLHSIFYKVNDNLCYSNEQEEVYLQDSLMITISHTRRSIEVSKVDIASKANMDILPLKKMDMQKMLRLHYTISREPDGDTGRIIIRSHEKNGISYSQMEVAYSKASYLPYLMEVTFFMKQPASDELIESLEKNGYDAQKMIQEKDGVKFILLSQTASIRFQRIESTKEKALQMPSWKEEILYDDTEKLFSGKGKCKGYEIIKTF